MTSSIWINTEIDRVWQAITGEEPLSKWYAPGSTWAIPLLAAGEKMVFTLMPSEHNKLTEPLSMELTIERVIKHQEFSFYLEVPETVIAIFLIEEPQGGTTVRFNMAGYDASLAYLKALLEDTTS